MTVAEIKEFIDKITSDIYSAYYNNYGELDYDEKEVKEIIDKRDKILSMLDELEPKAKWTNNMNGTFTCSRCGAKRPNDNYCGNCGARMNTKLKENNK